jgi:P4 family phage/plasmid primase-like protien
MSNSPNLEDYLRLNYASKGQQHTHTRIGDKEMKISGGLYNILDNKKFLEKYYAHVFENHKKEYLTEKQFVDKAPIVIDIDMRYENTITKKQHNKNHIIDGMMLIANKISDIFKFNDNDEIEIFIMEKNDVCVLDTKTKDGIHMIFGIAAHKAAHVLLRDKIMFELKEMWDDLPLTNSADELVDDGVMKGNVNWQMYGSRKPNCQAYMIKHHFKIIWKQSDEDWELQEYDILKFNTKENIHKLSARCSVFPEFTINNSVKEVYDKLKENYLNKKKPRLASKLIIKEYNSFNYKDITSSEKLDQLITNQFIDFETNPMEYELKETHDFVMILPESYWGPGSYNKWIRVGWALKNTNEKLFLTWIKFCSQSKDFKWNDIDDCVEYWNSFESNNIDGLTSRSIMYWAKIDNLKEYKKVRSQTVGFFMELTINNATEWDFAQVLYQMCKDQFVCVSVKNNIWYEYVNHRWFEIDSGNTLRIIISKKMHDLYLKKSHDIVSIELPKIDQSDDNYEPQRKRVQKIGDICNLLKKTTWKNNIMREAKELFYDKDFLNKVDQNPYLLCFNNYIIDFKNNTHRTGHPEDYISKCTNIDYIPYCKFTEKDHKLAEEIKEFINQLFPNTELREYMWQHLASCLIGTNDNQTFNIYTGSGRNGKSKLVDLMSKAMGDYKASVPITLVTQKRNNIGATSSEIVQLMGVRYAVMQEPTKGDKINEGIMKEITGGDPIQARALFKESVTFIPQFKLVVCTNTLFDIKSNDDGTWRRIRVCDFISKFLENPYGDEEKFPKADYPYQYDIDKRIDEKFEKWAPILMSILVEKVYKNNGIVKDCKIVLSSSDQYREGQDYLTEFTKEKVMKSKGGKIKKTELWETFRQWYTINYGRNLPKARELNDFMDKRYGKYNGKWNNIVINYDDDVVDDNSDKDDILE